MNIKVINAAISTEQAKLTGRARVFHSNDKSRFAQLAIHRKMATSSKLIVEMAKRGGPSVSNETFRLCLNEIGCYSILPNILPILTPQNVASRAKLVEDFKNIDWESVISSDESSIQLFWNKITVWNKENSTKKLISLKSPKFVVWGAISSKE